MGISKPYEPADTKLAKIAWLSAQDPNQMFYSLMHHINEESLHCCFKRLDGKKALGVDKISKNDYEENLDENIKELIGRMKQMAYRPQVIRQVLIPKEGKPGATRPLGISCFEDKLIQKRVQEILESIYEPLFLDCSYGFRPGKGCHDAIKDLRQHLYDEEVETVIDVDLAKFFDTIDHQILEDFLRIKVKDTKFMRYLVRLFKAGILAKGEIVVSDEGVAQGSVASPVCSNVMAHYVIDCWLEETVKPLMKGKIRAFRYADDLIICCRYENDAMRIKRALAKRLAKYKLTMNEEKTKMVSFSKSKKQQGIKPESFDFLGFTFYLGQSKSGRVIPKLKTNGKRIRSKLKRVNEWARLVRNKGDLKTIWEIFCAKLRGHIQYYGVSFNSRAVKRFRMAAIRLMFKWLNRRSQRKTFDWNRFWLFVEKYPPPPVKIYHKLF